MAPLDAGPAAEAGAGSGSVVSARDARQRKALEEQLRHSQKMEAIGKLAGGVAHDFNNLLVGVLANATLLRDLLPQTSELHTFLADIETAARRAADLSRDMLTFAGRNEVELDLNWIDWRDFGGENIEAKLADMTRKVVDADCEGRRYGLRLPECELQPDTGAQHRHACLTALALHGLGDGRRNSG